MSEQDFAHSEEIQGLYETARIVGLPALPFIKAMTNKKRNAITYSVHAELADHKIEIVMNAAGFMKLVQTQKSWCIEDGELFVVDQGDTYRWATASHEGRPVILRTPLRLTRDFVPTAHDVIDAFLQATSVYTDAAEEGGYERWKDAMQRFTQELADSYGHDVQISFTPHLLPLPCLEGTAEEENVPYQHNAKAHYVIVTEDEEPLEIDEEADRAIVSRINEIARTFQPKAAAFQISPGIMSQKTHQEIFEAFPA